MMSVLLECDGEGCVEDEYVDVYIDQLKAEAPLARWVGGGWKVVGSGPTGYPHLRCPECVEKETAASNPTE